MKNREFLIENFGKISLFSGLHPDFYDYSIPSSDGFHAKGPWGILCFQEVTTSKYFLRHFLFSLTQSITFSIDSGGNKLQSLFSIDGDFDFGITGNEKLKIKDRQFLLFLSSGQPAITTAYQGFTSMLNVHYAEGFYRHLVPYFAELKKDLKIALKRAHYFKGAAKTANNSIHNSIRAIWEEKYIPALQSKHIELRLESSLFTMLAQSYESQIPIYISPTEKKLADDAEKIILQNLKIHLTPEEIALQLLCSESSLRKAFRKVHGMPMYQFLRRSRMLYAHEQIASGASLKAVSIEIGMNPSNFPKEFKTFFGYTVTSLKKGLY